MFTRQLSILSTVLFSFHSNNCTRNPFAFELWQTVFYVHGQTWTDKAEQQEQGAAAEHARMADSVPRTPLNVYWADRKDALGKLLPFQTATSNYAQLKKGVETESGRQMSHFSPPPWGKPDVANFGAR